MARTYSSVRPKQPRFPSGKLDGFPSLVAIALVGAIGGVLLGAVQEYITAAHLLKGEYYWSSVLIGNALVLGFGWAMMSLWGLRSNKWLIGATFAALLAGAAAFVGAVATKMGVELK